MGLSPRLMRPLAEAIGEVLTLEQMQDAVLAATGNELDYYAPDSLLLHEAVEETLRQLDGVGRERWLLTQVLAQVMTDDTLRRHIVNACPESLIPSQVVQEQVDRVTRTFDEVVKALARETLARAGLRRSRGQFGDIIGQVATLATYKALHEGLHTLHLQLLRPSLALGDPDAELKDLDSRLPQIKSACTAARAAAAPLGARTVELAWIGELDGLARQYEAAIGAREIAAAVERMSEVQRLVRRWLSRLNARILETSRKLSLTDLFVAIRREFRAGDFQTAVVQWESALLGIIPTVLARALYHAIWQDIENQVALLADWLDGPSVDGELFSEHWANFRYRILWLATCDPDAAWGKKAMEDSARLADWISRREIGPECRQLCQDHFKKIRDRFLRIDAAFKGDCGRLGAIGPPLTSFLQELDNAR